MGQGLSLPSYHKAVPKDGDKRSHVVISNEPANFLSFNPLESYLVCYGIDLQTSPNYSNHTLPPTTVAGTQQLMDALVNTGMIPKSNTSLYAASKDIEQCKIRGMKRVFQDCARKVGQNGIFVFVFSGHGIKIQNSEWALAPADFDYTQYATFLTSHALGQWLSEVNCNAMHTLFILDCCYTGGIASTLTEFSDLPVKGSLSVLSACTANQSSVIIASLGASIFTFFLSHAISTLCKSGKPNSVEFPLKTIFSECHVCSKALSSLIITSSETNGIRVMETEPTVAVVYPNSEIAAKGERRNRIESDFSEVKGFQYAHELYDHTSGAPLLPVDEKTRSMIRVWHSPNGPLHELNKRHLLRGQLLNAALCSMMHSIATIELSCDASHSKVTEVNFSITAFIQVATALSEIVKDLVIPNHIFFQSWLYYLKALHIHNKSLIDGFEPLLHKLMRDENYNPNQVQSNRSDSTSTRASSSKRVSRESISKACVHIL